MIAGINPYCISMVEVQDGYRVGHHPYKWALMKRKSLLWYRINGPTKVDSVFDRWVPAKVIIYGSNGRALKYIECYSNARARELAKEIQGDLMKEINA